MKTWPIGASQIRYRARLYFAQSTVKKDPDRAKQSSLATAGTNFTKPGAHNKWDLCTVSMIFGVGLAKSSYFQGLEL